MVTICGHHQPLTWVMTLPFHFDHLNRPCRRNSQTWCEGIFKGFCDTWIYDPHEYFGRINELCLPWHFGSSEISLRGEVLASLLVTLSHQAVYWYPFAFIGSMAWTAFSIFISCIQAYVFTMLSSIYIGKKINGEE